MPTTRDWIITETFMGSMSILAAASMYYYLTQSEIKKAQTRWDASAVQKSETTNSSPTNVVVKTNWNAGATLPEIRKDSVKTVASKSAVIPALTAQEVIKWYFETTPRASLKASLVTDCDVCSATIPLQTVSGYRLPSYNDLNKKDFFVERKGQQLATKRLLAGFEKNEKWAISLRKEAQRFREWEIMYPKQTAHVR